MILMVLFFVMILYISFLMVKIVHYKTVKMWLLAIYLVYFVSCPEDMTYRGECHDPFVYILT